MQRQLQLVSLRNAQTRQELDQFIGIVEKFDDPLNIYFNLDDIINNRTFIYWFAYGARAKRAAIWGVYDTRTAEFSFDGSCKYNTKELLNLLKLKKQQDYTYAGNIVRNRPHEIISERLNIKLLSKEDYTKYKYIVAYFDGLISAIEANSVLGDRFIEDEIAKISFKCQVNPEEAQFKECVDTYLYPLKKKIFEYEQSANIIDKGRLDRSLPPDLYGQIENLTEDFYEQVEHGEITSNVYYEALTACPTYEQCREGFLEGCEVYFYGSNEEVDERYFNEDDPRLLL